MRAFGFETRTTWNNDPNFKRLVDNGKLEKALGQFRYVVTVMSMARGISKDDMADIFQRVTGAEMDE